MSSCRSLDLSTYDLDSANASGDMLSGKLDAGNLHVQFDEGEGAAAGQQPLSTLLSLWLS